MNYDPTNPFHKLAKALAAQEKVKDAASHPPAVAAPCAPSRSRRGDSDGCDDDTALFLNAVGRIKPPASKRNKKADAGERLAGHMRSGGDLAAGPERARAGISAQPAAFPPATKETPLLEAPQDPFESPAKEFACEENALFAQAMRGVAPVNGKGRDIAVVAGQGRPAPAQDPAKALRDVLEGRVEFALHHGDEFMEGYVVGMDPLVFAKLRAGQYSPEKHLDMHGMNARQAYDALIWFIRDAYQKGLRCVVVVTGRGRNSPDGVGVLRPLLQRWLSRDPFKRVVLAFCTARPEDGGPGAAYVLLRKYKKNRGKIIWDHTPLDENF